MFDYHIICSIGIYILSVSSSSSLNVNDYVPACKISDPFFNDCLLGFLQNAITTSAEGSGSLHIPKIDPYFIPKITLRSPAGLLIEHRNSSYLGFTKARLKLIKTDVDKCFFEAHLFTPKVSLTGDYTLTGKLFSFPLNGQGKSNITFANLQNIIRIQGDLQENNSDQKFMKVKSVNMKMKIKRMFFRFNNLFKENKELGEVVNQMLNDNWEELFQQLKPQLEEEMSKHVRLVAEKYFDQIPYSDIFPNH